MRTLVCLAPAQVRDPEPVWRVAWTILLPRPEGMDRGCITTAPPWWRRLARQVIPRRTTWDCCYYHRVNWRQVSAAAIRVTRQARCEGLAGEAFGDRVAVLAAAQGLPEGKRRRWTICSLSIPPSSPARVSARDTPTDGTARPRCSTPGSAGPPSSAGWFCLLATSKQNRPDSGTA